MGNLRGWEWLIILVVVLLLFGASRLPTLARSLGQSMKIFRSEVKDLGDKGPADTSTGADGAPRRTTTPTAGTTDDDSERHPL
jgi:sec-independent protein translocase protein TatA